MVETVFDYFTKVAEKTGEKKPDENGAMKPDENGNIEQSTFSVHWMYKYYQNLISAGRIEELGDITRALLGDDTILEGLDWYAGLDINIEEYLLEDNVNDDQKRAIKTALTKPVSFIQGPPGTGKSRTIVNMLSCIVNGLGKNAIVIATNNEAINVISDSIKSFANSNDQRKSKLYKNLAELGNQKRVEAFVEKHKHTGYGFTYKPNDDLGVSVVSDVSFDEFTRDFKIILSTIHSAKKNFKDALDKKYDYCIMDESSQTNTMLGVLASMFAEHFIIVGDKEQLAPVFEVESITDINSDFHNEDIDPYIIRDDNLGCPPSIIDLCKSRFARENNQVLLKHHYRCQPGIIQFSNYNIYKELVVHDPSETIHSNASEFAVPSKELVVQEPSETIQTQASKFAVPIRVKWYEGDYCESVRRFHNEDSVLKTLVEDKQLPASSTSKRNRKQVEIFVREELANLIKKMDDKQDGLERFCILSPFRGQLYELEKRVRERLKELGRDDITAELIRDDLKIDEYTMPLLSVHKSQGKEYDVVYFLPVEDGKWDRPWSQSKSLINVAVSRAKKELHIIVSTLLMSPHMQKELIGTSIEKTAYEGNDTDYENIQFVRKLVDYVYIANMQKEEYLAKKDIWDPDGVYETLEVKGKKSKFPKSDDEYGFHETALKSVFDAAPLYHMLLPDISRQRKTPQYILRQAIEKEPHYLAGEWRLYEEVPFKKVEKVVDDNREPILTESQIQEQTNEYRRKKGLNEIDYIGESDDEYSLHIDFVITNSENRVLLFIEVDGEFHRFQPFPRRDDITEEEYDKKCIKELLKGEVAKARDELKDQLCEEIYKVPLLRLKTDGTSCDEIRQIRAKIKPCNAWYFEE